MFEVTVLQSSNVEAKKQAYPSSALAIEEMTIPHWNAKTTIKI